MKKFALTLAISLLALTGCSVIDAYLMTHYDPNEYQLITSVRLKAQQSKQQCDDFSASKINSNQIESDTRMFMLYSEYIPRNKDLIDAGKNLYDIAKGLSDQYNKNEKVSSAFCKIKFTNLETNADKIQAIVARRPR